MTLVNGFGSRDGLRLRYSGKPEKRDVYRYYSLWALIHDFS